MPTIQVVETDEPVREGGGATLATAVYERLRADVISGALLPGKSCAWKRCASATASAQARYARH